MKKRLALLLACTMALSLTACGGGKAADPTTTAAPAPPAANHGARRRIPRQQRQPEGIWTP